MNRMSVDDFRKLHGTDKRPAITQVAGRPVQQSRRPDRPMPRHFTCSLPFLPPTTNHLFLTLKTGVRVRTKEYVRFVKNCEKLVHGTLDPDCEYELSVVVTAPIYTKAGKLRKWDASNRVKALEDVLAERLGIDDRQFMRVVVEKRHGEDGCKVVITELPKVAA